MKIRVCSPSWHRPKVETLAYIPWDAVYVDEAEAASYRAENPGAEIAECPKGVQGNLPRVRNWLLDREFANGADVVAMVDDDFQRLEYWENGVLHKLPTAELMGFIEEYSILCAEWGFKMWGVNCVSDKVGYQEFRPFTTLAFFAGPFQVHLRGGGLRYDERLYLKDDYDMFVQQCDKWRGVLRINKYHAVVRIATNLGGTASRRNFIKEKQQLELLRRKWGGVVRNGDEKIMNYRKQKGKKAFDFNPIIKIPIKGV